MWGRCWKDSNNEPLGSQWKTPGYIKTQWLCPLSDPRGSGLTTANLKPQGCLDAQWKKTQLLHLFTRHSTVTEKLQRVKSWDTQRDETPARKKGHHTERTLTSKKELSHVWTHMEKRELGEGSWCQQRLGGRGRMHLGAQTLHPHGQKEDFSRRNYTCKCTAAWKGMFKFRERLSSQQLEYKLQKRKHWAHRPGGMGKRQPASWGPCCHSEAQILPGRHSRSWKLPAGNYPLDQHARDIPPFPKRLTLLLSQQS